MPRIPEVTIVTATHNRADLLPRAIDSVLAQTFRNFEYIIVNDNSTDETEEVLKKYKDKRIRVLLNTENPLRTHCRPFNEAIKQARGKYIAYLDDDNEWYPFHLEILLKAFEQDKELDVAYCDMMIHGEDGSTQYGIAMDFDAQFLINRNFIDTSEVMHKKEMIFNVGGWNEKVPRFTDWNLWIRMAKWGAKFQRVPIIALKYFAHGGDSQSKRTEVDHWFDPAFGMTMFQPPFDPAGDFIFERFLDGREKEMKPKVAIFTLTYDRLDYSKRMIDSLRASTDYDFDWYVWDNGSTDGTKKWLMDEVDTYYVHSNGENLGITKPSNALLDVMKDNYQPYQIIIKVDNDCEFATRYWLESIVDLWKRNHMLYMSPYPEGLVHHPGGAPRIGYGRIGPYDTEVVQHIGGLCAAIDARAYDDFRWTDQFKHGNQDSEASLAFRELGYMPCYIPFHRVVHMDTTDGQQKKYKEYFERRVKEKTEVA